MEYSKSKIAHKQWLFGKWVDVFLLNLPVWLIWLLCFLLPESTLNAPLPLWMWVVFILGIDVSHVWSTIFRTYLDKEEFRLHRKTLVYAPLVCFLALLLCAAISYSFFWRIMAYIALHHFIKQQYGFTMLYRAKHRATAHNIFFKDKWVIYFAMLYPVAYWHFADTLLFNWFIAGDFLNFREWLLLLPFVTEAGIGQFFSLANVGYWIIMVAWLFETWWTNHKNAVAFPIGKVLWVLGTAVNWYLGIVYFNSEIAFSLTNVVAHGIPYMVLIFFYVEKKKKLVADGSTYRFPIKSTFWSISLMVGMVLLLAFGEEYLWDLFVNREKGAFFEAILPFPFQFLSNYWAQALFAALLSVPQVTHYIVDGYIWKNSKNNPHLGKILMG